MFASREPKRTLYPTAHVFADYARHQLLLASSPKSTALHTTSPHPREDHQNELCRQETRPRRKHCAPRGSAIKRL